MGLGILPMNIKCTLYANAALMAISAVQMFLKPDFYFDGSVSHKGASAEKELFVFFMTIWFLNNASLMVACAEKPTRETAIFGCAIWIFWTVMNLMGPLMNPDFMALGMEKSAMLCWPILGSAFSYRYYKHISQLAPVNSSEKLSPAILMNCLVCLINIGVFLGQAGAAKQMYFPRYSPNTAVGEKFLSLTFMNNGVCSIGVMLLSWTMRFEPTRFQFKSCAAGWVFWLMGWSYLFLQRPEVLSKLGADRTMFISWFPVQIIFITWFKILQKAEAKKSKSEEKKVQKKSE